MQTNIVHVDSSQHAESVIKSLRSASLSQRRYQRNAESGESIFTTLANFDTIVSTQLKETTRKQDIDAKINIVPAASHFPVKDASEDSDNESPMKVSWNWYRRLHHLYNGLRFMTRANHHIPSIQVLLIAIAVKMSTPNKKER